MCVECRSLGPSAAPVAAPSHLDSIFSSLGTQVHSSLWGPCASSRQGKASHQLQPLTRQLFMGQQGLVVKDVALEP